MVLLLVFASEDSLHFFIPAKHLNHIEFAVLVSECVGAFTQQLIDLIKSFIIYLLPLFVITSKRIFKKIQMYKTTKNIYWNVKAKKLFIDNQKIDYKRFLCLTRRETFLANTKKNFQRGNYYKK